MSSEQRTIEIDTLEIVDLEYEVGGMSAVEPADARMSHRDSVVIVITQD
jgi:hypothetical protein